MRKLCNYFPKNKKKAKKSTYLENLIEFYELKISILIFFFHKSLKATYLLPQKNSWDTFLVNDEINFS